MAEFDGWSAYYDFIHKGLPGEVEFYVGQALRYGGETLELGCGTGRVCIPMAMSGGLVTGLDLSMGMLQVCREKAAALGTLRGALSLLCGDMRAFALSRRFRFIAMPYRTFMHLLTPEEQLRCLRCVHGHLDPEGVFALNLCAPRAATVARFSGREGADAFQLVGAYPVPDEGITLVHFHAAHYDEYRQWIVERHRIQEKDASGTVVHEETLTLTRAYSSPREMEHLLYRSGFEADALLGGFDGIPFGEDSTEMIWVLRKR